MASDRQPAPRLTRSFGALGLKEYDKALGALERALIRHEPFFTSEPMNSPIFAPIKDARRLADIRAKVGLR